MYVPCHFFFYFCSVTVFELRSEKTLTWQQIYLEK